MRMNFRKSVFLFSVIFAVLLLNSCENSLLIDATNLYKVSFETNCSEQIESYRTASVEKIRTLQKEDADFMGWYTNSAFRGNAVTFPYELNGDTTLYAKWNQKYTVLFQANGGSEVAGKKTSVIQEHPDTTRNGYYFAGWYEAADFSSEAVSFPYTLTKATTLYAKWLKIYTVSFETNGGTSPEPNPMQTAIIASSPVTKKDGCRFLGWYKEQALNNQVAFPYTVNSDIKLYAGWVDASNSLYTVKHYLQDESLKSYILYSEQTKGGIAQEKTLAQEINYTGFTAKPYVQKTILEDNSTVVEIYYDRNEYTLTLNPNGGSGNNITKKYYYGIQQSLPANTFTKNNYIFKGWATSSNGSATYTDNGAFTIEQDTTLYAVWEPVSFSITYILNGGTNDGANPTSYTIESSEITLKNPVRNGYEFDGWYKTESFGGETATTIETGSTGNKTFYAKWKPITYSITYELNGGSIATANPSSYTIESATITLNSPVREGYTFGGWYTDSDFSGNAITEIKTGTYGNKTLYAKWTTTEYTITYMLYGGTNSSANKTSYTKESPAITLYSAWKTGYDFAGWYTSTDSSAEKITQIPSGSSGNKSFYARWTPIEYTITYNLNGGENASSNPATYTIETPTITLKSPTRTGYIFGGWYTTSTFTGNAITQIAKGSAGNKTLYAKWTAINYTITYNLNDGTNDSTNPTNYTIESNTITLAEPTRTGYTFKGWYTNSDFTGSQVTQVGGGATGDTVLYARWEVVEYTVTADNINSIDLSNAIYISVNGKISQDFLQTLGEKLKSDTMMFTVDLSKASGITTIKWISSSSGSCFEDTKIQTAILSNELTSIGSGAFSSCKYFTEIKMPLSITRIERDAFSYSGLKEIEIPSSIKYIGAYAFAQTKISRVEIPNSVIEIDSEAFYQCAYLTEVVLPTSLEKIGGDLFAGCKKLSTIIYQGTVEQWKTLYRTCTSWLFGLSYSTQIDAVPITCTDGVYNWN